MATFHYDNNSKSSGIYVIFNNLNWRLYVGSCKCFQARWSQHFASLSKGRHQNYFLQADFLKCGSAAFEFYVLDDMPGSTRVERLTREETWVAKHFDNGKRCYNLQKECVSREGFKSKDPEETRRKHSEASKKMWAAYTEDQKKARAAKSAIKRLGIKNPKTTNSLKKMWAAMTPQEREIRSTNLSKGAAKKGPVVQYTFRNGKVGKKIRVFESAQEAYNLTGISVWNCVLGRAQSAGGFVWRRMSN